MPVILYKYIAPFKRLFELFRQSSFLKKIIVSAVCFFAAIFVFGMTLIILTWIGAFGTLPDNDELLAVKNPVASEVYSADSVLLGRYFLQERSDIRYADLPEYVVQSLIATEDARFFTHHGVDTRSLGRVFVKSILFQKESSGGGSTITQQLAKNLYPRRNYVALSLVINKIREVIIARRLEQVYDKKNLLTLYLNTIPFGDNTFGIEAAAQRFFSVPARKLSIQQGAVLIGMLKATYAYNPRVYPTRSIKRRNVVLRQMEKYNKITSGQSDSLQKLPLVLTYTQITHHTGLAPYFRAYLRSELQTWCSLHTRPDGKPYNLYTDGLKIYTTINAQLQSYAERAVEDQMAGLQHKFIRNNTLKSVRLDELVKRSLRYRSLKSEGYDTPYIDSVMHAPSAMSIFTWQGEKEVMMSPIDSIRHYIGFLNAGFLAMQPETGAIQAWVGGINHHYFQFDHIHESTKRQVGSTFKPIVYAAALERGADPCRFISAEKTTYSDQEHWTPENSEDNYDLKYSMEGALAHSVNTVSVKVLETAGIENTIALARRMGITSDLPAVPSLALGTANISMIEMVSAYACLAHAGRPVKPYFITAIATPQSDVLERFAPVNDHTQALSAEHAAMIIHMLKRTINEGTGTRLRSSYNIQNDVAGKTGTTQSNTDGWFMALTPHLIIGAWVGADNPNVHFRTTSMGQGAATALPIAARFLQYVNADPAFHAITRATFPALSDKARRDLDCSLYKSDETFLEKIFGKREKERNKVFGETTAKKGFFKRLFGKD